MDILGKAVSDSREVFLDVVNRLEDEITTKNNNTVDDMAKVVAEIENVIAETVHGKRRAQEDLENMAKQLSDFESHLNTTMITEKSVRKAQDKQLAEEVDDVHRTLNSFLSALRTRVEKNEAQFGDQNKLLNGRIE